MTHRSPLQLCATLTLALLGSMAIGSGSARADTVGSAGALESLTLYSSSSTEYENRHGELVVREAGNIARTYYFGGSRCAYQTLASDQLDLLGRTVNRNGVTVTPYYVSGVSGSRCVVGFSMQGA